MFLGFSACVVVACFVVVLDRVFLFIAVVLVGCIISLAKVDPWVADGWCTPRVRYTEINVCTKHYHGVGILVANAVARTYVY